MGILAEPEVYVLVAFVLFFVLVGRRLWSAIASMLDARAAEVRAELDEAERLKREAEAMLRDAETRRAAALEDAKRLLDGARAEARRIGQAAAEEAAASAKRREQMAVDRIAAAEKAAVTEVRVAATDVATEAARDVLGLSFDAEADERLIDRAIMQLPAALSARRAA